MSVGLCTSAIPPAHTLVPPAQQSRRLGCWRTHPCTGSQVAAADASCASVLQGRIAPLFRTTPSLTIAKGAVARHRHRQVEHKGAAHANLHRALHGFDGGRRLAQGVLDLLREARTKSSNKRGGKLAGWLCLYLSQIGKQECVKTSPAERRQHGSMRCMAAAPPALSGWLQCWAGSPAAAHAVTITSSRMRLNEKAKAIALQEVGMDSFRMIISSTANSALLSQSIARQCVACLRSLPEGVEDAEGLVHVVGLDAANASQPVSGCTSCGQGAPRHIRFASACRQSTNSHCARHCTHTTCIHPQCLASSTVLPTFSPPPPLTLDEAQHQRNGAVGKTGSDAYSADPPGRLQVGHLRG